MKISVLVILILLIVSPFFVLAGATLKDILETKRQIKKNEEEIRDKIDHM